jgi:hypothetical protein
MSAHGHGNTVSPEGNGIIFSCSLQLTLPTPVTAAVDHHAHNIMHLAAEITRALSTRDKRQTIKTDR